MSKLEQIEVSVKTQYIAEQSNKQENRFVFAYTITIENNSNIDSVQLLSRYWLITDGNGERSTVVGDGVIGKQPNIAKNERFTYTSGCILKTAVGTMEGHYQMLTPDGQEFSVAIPVFGLAVPNIVN